MHFDDSELAKKVIRKKLSFRLRKKRDGDATPAPVETHTLQTTRITKEEAIHMIDSGCRGVIFGLIFLLPLFFLPATSDVLELNKQHLLFCAIGILAILSVVSSALKEQFEIKKSFIFLGLLAVVLAWLASSIFSRYPYNSLIGLDRQEFASFLSILLFALFFWIFVHTMRYGQTLKAIGCFLASVTIANVIGLAQLFGVFVLPWQFAKNPAFNTIGLYDIWGGMAAAALVLAAGLLVLCSFENSQRRALYAACLSLAIVSSALSLVVMEDWRLWLGVIVGLIGFLTILFLRLPADKKIPWIMAPAFLIVLSVAFLILRDVKLVSLPLNVQPSWRTSAAMMAGAIQDAPLFGYGPGNFLPVYTKYRPQEINSVNILNLWNVRFEQSGSYLFTTVAHVGLVGLAATLSFVILIGWGIARAIRAVPLTPSTLLLLAISAGLFTLGVIALTKPANMALAFVHWFFAACLVSLLPLRTITITIKNQNQHLLASSLAISAVVLATATGSWFMAQRYGADLLYGRALEQDQRVSTALRSRTAFDPSEIDSLIEKLSRTFERNPHNAYYARSLSQGLLYKLGGLVAAGGLSSQLEPMKVLASSAVDAAKRATSLNPSDVRNFQNLANIYHALVPYTDGADFFAQEAYKRAIALDPSNPSLYIEHARLSIDVAAKHYRVAGNQKDEAVKKNEKGAGDTTLHAADELLEKALALKANLPQASYLRALIRAQQERKNEALEALTKSLSDTNALIQFQGADLTLFSLISNAYSTLGEKTKALETARAGLSVLPQDPDLLWAYGTLLADEGEKEKAIQILTQLLQFAPGNQQVDTKLRELRGEIPIEEKESSASTSTEESTEKEKDADAESDTRLDGESDAKTSTPEAAQQNQKKEKLKE